MKLCTCFSALVNSNFLAMTATTRAVQPAPYLITQLLHTQKNQVIILEYTIRPVVTAIPRPQSMIDSPENQ